MTSPRKMPTSHCDRIGRGQLRHLPPTPMAQGGPRVRGPVPVRLRPALSRTSPWSTAASADRNGTLTAPPATEDILNAMHAPSLVRGRMDITGACPSLAGTETMLELARFSFLVCKHRPCRSAASSARSPPSSRSWPLPTWTRFRRCCLSGPVFREVTSRWRDSHGPRSEGGRSRSWAASTRSPARCPGP